MPKLPKKLPLEGIRVLDLTVVWAGPYCASFLADLGAEVIRVETVQTFVPLSRGPMAHPSEEALSKLPPSFGGAPGGVPGARPWNRVPVFNAHARNKLSMTVDLRQPRGREMFHRLAKISDVLVENNPTETMDKLGISYQSLQEQNPQIIMLRMPAFGNTGRYQNYRAFGVHIEGLIGHTLLRGYADMDPWSNTGVFMGDAASGSQGAFAVLAALHYRKRTGKGQLVELSQAENSLPFFGQAFMDYTMNGRSTATSGNRHPHAIQGCYPCQGDDRWVCITIYDDADWEAFCVALDHPGWSQDDRFADTLRRLRHQDEIDKHISEWTRQHDHYWVMHRLQEHGVAAGPVLDQRDAYQDPHFNDRGVFQEVYQEDTGTYRYVGPPYKMSVTSTEIRRGPVLLGQDNEYVYKTLLNVSDAEYAELEAEGHIGMDNSEGLP